MSQTEVTLVTGASAGIGQAIARALIAQGRTVVNIDRVAPDWSDPHLVSFQADLTDAASTREVAEAVTRQYPITALVNNAGATRPGTIDSASLDDLDAVVGLHLQAALLLTQAALPSLRACGHGRIVNMASRAALGVDS